MSLVGQSQRDITRLAADGSRNELADQLVMEEPLEIRLNESPIAVVMRTPGDDIALSLGFLFSEGILNDPDQVLSVQHCQEVTDDARGNVVQVRAAGADHEAADKARRQVYASSSCGLCGKTTLDSVRLLAPPMEAPPPIRASTLAALPELLRANQALFDSTGGLHAAGLFTYDGDVRLVREDIGRHNACDKVIGTYVMREQWPLTGHILSLSGRASFEMIQKAAMAGIGVVAAVSAPSTLAVDLAKESQMTLVGFVRDGSMNVYSGRVS
ncbi:MAG: sulfurtransferase FdhD [Deltaproteobacteria bacterium]|nr:sulfurtransferase FdhD [Deltaproteobacteria bacterium]|tara:strand:- start:137 stop:946 length:810 start_codon:yes stop_codon:yes gene_type:complete